MACMSVYGYLLHSGSLIFLQKDKVKWYHLCTQNLARTQQLQAKKDPTRHSGDNSMAYDEEERPGYESVEETQSMEHAGVLHLVHGWIQQSQKGKVSSSIHFFHSTLKTKNVIGTFYLQEHDEKQQRLGCHHVVLPFNT